MAENDSQEDKGQNSKNPLVIDFNVIEDGQPHWLSGIRNPEKNPKPNRTPEEQDILNFFLRAEGQEYVDKFAESLLHQARIAGDL
jgi:hypothetical protein